MGFVPITIDKYLSLHLKKNPADNEADLRKRLLSALNDHKNGIKCSCGNDIWIIGSVFVGNACFTCITGEAYPTEDFEIDSAMTKKENIKGRRHIDDIEPTKIAGFFDDSGYEINADLIKKPSLCLICKNDDNPEEEMLCNMTRYDQKDDNGFKCFAFSKK